MESGGGLKNEVGIIQKIPNLFIYKIKFKYSNIISINIGCVNNKGFWIFQRFGFRNSYCLKQDYCSVSTYNTFQILIFWIVSYIFFLQIKFLISHKCDIVFGRRYFSLYLVFINRTYVCLYMETRNLWTERNLDSLVLLFIHSPSSTIFVHTHTQVSFLSVQGSLVVDVDSCGSLVIRVEGIFEEFVYVLL